VPKFGRFGRKVPHLRCNSHTSFKVKRSKIRVTRPINANTQGLRTSNLVYGWRMTTRISHMPLPPRLKVKVTRSHGISDHCGPYYEISTWYSDRVTRRVWPTIAVTSKVKDQGHKLTSSVHFISASS